MGRGRHAGARDGRVLARDGFDGRDRGGVAVAADLPGPGRHGQEIQPPHVGARSVTDRCSGKSSTSSAGSLGRFGRWLGTLITVLIGGGSLVLGAMVLSPLVWTSDTDWSLWATNTLSVALAGGNGSFMGWLLQCANRVASRGVNRRGTPSAAPGTPC